MRDKKQMKKIILHLILVILLFSVVGCSSNNEKKESTEKKSIEDNNKNEDEEMTIETQIENDILRILGFSEEKDDIVRLGSDDDGSDDQSVTVNEEDGSFDLFISVSKESTGIDSAGDGPMVGIIVAHDLKKEKESVPKMEAISKELFKAISKYEYIDWVSITNQLVSDDNSKYSKALTINLEKETLDKIDWDSFNPDKFKTIADEYLLDEDLKS